MKNKNGQEEMVGFAMIIIIVTIILFFFLWFSLKNSQKEAVESYEVESFINSFLDYTTECKDNLGFLPVQKLIRSCREDDTCLNGKTACEVLNSTLTEIARESWKTGKENIVEGYNLEIVYENSTIFNLKAGNETNQYKGAVIYLKEDIYFKVYY